MRMRRLIEPFAGSAAISLACAVEKRAVEYWLNDCNEPLMKLFFQIINHPVELCDFYDRVWRDHDTEHLEHYYRVRDEFNRTRDSRLFLYLLARCVKGSVRYNSDGLFNQSPDKRRLGKHPETMRQNIMAVSALLRGRAIITSRDYRDVLDNARATDIIYMDPPYQGVCGDRDARYFSGIDSADFISALDQLNAREIQFMVSYDGSLGDRVYGEPLPDWLNLTHLEIEAGRSSQSTLLGREEQTIESLYLSPSLAANLNFTTNRLSLRPEFGRQLELLAVP